MSHSFKFDGLNWWNTSDSWRCEGKTKKWIVSCQSIADFQQFAFVEKRSFFPRCLRFQGFLDLMDSHGIQYILLCFASFCFSSCDRWEKHEGKTNSGNFWQGQIAQYVSLVSAVPATQLQALAEALAVNKTLRSLTMGFYEAPGFNGSRAGRAHGLNWQALRTVEEMKRGRGDDFRFISREEDKKEAEGCWGLRSR